MKKITSFIILILLVFTLASCKKEDEGTPDIFEVVYQNDVYYSLFVRSFADSDGDGIGDLNGITENLNYFEDLGITGIWLLPIFESPSYHGYDTTDYYKINPEYGTMEDLENLIDEANSRDIKVILDLVINHTSDKHPWYLSALEGESSEYYDYYVWGIPDSFVGGMKDLNLENPLVVNEIYSIAEFYLNKGISGFRLDAVSHFFNEAGLNAVMAKNIVFMSRFNDYVKTINENAFIVGEVFLNDYDILNNYIMSGTSYFNFYLQNEIENKVGNGNSRTLLAKNIVKNYQKYYETDPNYVDSPFLGNHDMDRIANLYRTEQALKQAIQVLMTLPGNPFIYYGDELGMKGVEYKGDLVNGRTVYDEYRRQPFIWGDERDTTWLSSDGSNDLTKSYLEQKEDPNSIYNFTKEMIKLRKDNPALGEGLGVYNLNKTYNLNNLQAYVRVVDNEYFKQVVLVVHNMYDNVAEVNLSLEVIYGSKQIPAYGMAIFEIPYDDLGRYIE